MFNTLSFWILAIIPALVYPFMLYAYGRRFLERKELIRSLLRTKDTKAMRHYSKTFRTSGDLDGAEWSRRLDFDIEAALYPIALCSLVSLAGWVVVLSVINGAGPLSPALVEYLRLHKAAVAGFLGAYVWGLYDFTDRFRILNLPSSALYSSWFRLILAPVAAHFAQVVLNDQAAPAVGFAIGMLPVATIVSWIQDNGRKRLSLTSGADVPAMWEHIQGMTPDIISRLVEAGVSNAAHLANQDPVKILRRTNLEWRNVLDMMDQAFLLIYVGPPIAKLRAMGIRGAIEAAVLYQRLRVESDATGEAHMTLAAVAKELDRDALVTQNLLHNLWEDPQVRVIWSLWYDDSSVQASPIPAQPQQTIAEILDIPASARGADTAAEVKTE
jgi:hypothetical protein